MPSNGIQAHRQNIGNFTNTRSLANEGMPSSKMSTRLSTVGNATVDFPEVPIRDPLSLESGVTQARPLTATGALQTALLCLYAQSRLGGAPSSSWQNGTSDTGNRPATSATPSGLYPAWSGQPYRPIPPVVEAGNGQVAGADLLAGVAAQPKAPLLPSGARQSTSIATYLGQLGNSLMSAGALGFVRQHPGRVAAYTVAAGLGTFALAKAWDALRGGSPLSSSLVDIRRELAVMKQADGETLDSAVSNAIHGCAGNSSCERAAVAHVLNPYKEQLGYARQARGSSAAPFSGATAAALMPDSDWSALIDNVIDAYHHWDEQSFLSDIELIARAPTNDDRREVIINMLDERGFSSRTQPFTGQPAKWLGADLGPVSGINIIADVAGPESGAQAPVLLLGAHYDKIGEGSEGAYDNGSGCAVVLELGRRLQEQPPENCHIKMAFFGEEEQGLIGSKALVQECRDENNCPAMMINIDLAASGNQIYAGSSNATHAVALFADDPDAVKTAMPERPSETRLLDGMRAAAEGTTLKVVQNKGTPMSDHLSYQFKGVAALGVSLLEEGQPDEMERVAQGMGAVKTTSDAIDWGSLKSLKVELDAAYASGDSERINHAQNNYINEAGKQPLRPYSEALGELESAGRASSAIQALHNANDTLASIHPRDVVKFIDVMEQGIRDFCRNLPAST